MATVFDVAAYILERTGAITTVKLQKLVYYCQAWSLVWDERPLFDERIEAWVNGPVVPELFEWHRGQFQVSACERGDPDALDADARETIDKVLEYYGGRETDWLVELTHLEDPWREARNGLPPTERGSNEIVLGSMLEYYSGL